MVVIGMYSIYVKRDLDLKRTARSTDTPVFKGKTAYTEYIWLLICIFFVQAKCFLVIMHKQNTQVSPREDLVVDLVL